MFPNIRIRQPNKYYISNRGLDSNSGTITKPWKTISRVNNAILFPGDQIYFKAGEIFTGPLKPATSGNLDQPIIFSVYGVGARPIIDGSDFCAFLIYSTPYHNLYIEHLDFAGASENGKSTVICCSHDVYFYDCIFRDLSFDIWGMGFLAMSETDGTDLYNITLDSCEAYNNHSCGISIQSSTGADGPHDCIVKNCTVHDNGTNEYADHGIYVKHGVTVENCICYKNKHAGIKTNCMLFPSPYYPIVRNNICYDNYVGFQIDNYNSLVYNNLLYCNNNNIWVSEGGNGSEFYFNTLVNHSGAGGEVKGDLYFSSTIWKNNIIINDYLVNNQYLISADDGYKIEWI